MATRALMLAILRSRLINRVLSLELEFEAAKRSSSEAENAAVAAAAAP